MVGNADLTVPCDRTLMEAERELLRAALTQAGAWGTYFDQLPLLKVVSESKTTWPVLEFSVAGRSAALGEGMQVVADFQYSGENGLLGLFIYSRGGLLAGMECWSIDGGCNPEGWPTGNMLTPLAVARPS